MAEYTAIEQEQQLLDEKDSCELFDATNDQRRMSTGLHSCLGSPPLWISYVFIVYTIISIPILVWTALSLQKTKYRPYCKSKPAPPLFLRCLTRASACEYSHRL
jgi:hypothetical protein